jgi:hypothetical protein
LMRQLRRLHLAQFNMADDAFEKGLGQCSSLEAMHLESQQVCQTCVSWGWCMAARGRALVICM